MKQGPQARGPTPTEAARAERQARSQQRTIRNAAHKHQARRSGLSRDPVFDRKRQYRIKGRLIGSSVPDIVIKTSEGTRVGSVTPESYGGIVGRAIAAGEREVLAGLDDDGQVIAVPVVPAFVQYDSKDSRLIRRGINQESARADQSALRDILILRGGPSVWAEYHRASRLNNRGTMQKIRKRFGCWTRAEMEESLELLAPE